MVTPEGETFAVSKADLEHECETMSCYFKVYVAVVTVKSLLDLQRTSWKVFCTSCRIYKGKTHRTQIFTVAASIQ